MVTATQVAILLLTFLSIYYLIATMWLSLGLSKLRKSDIAYHHTFTVIIAAHNEEANIKKTLDSVLNQSIGSDKYEVILANDRSTDNTLRIANEYVLIHDNFRIVNITETPEDLSPKKYALSTAMKEAKNEIIVFTDADCIVKPRWLETIDKNFFTSIDLVQGITTYSNVNGINSLLYGFQAIDFLSHGIVSAAGIGNNFPINSNANNFAFRKEAYEKNKGFSKIKSVISGDDDLLMQTIWNKKEKNIQYMTDPEGAVETLPTFTLSGVFEQRKRWGSKTTYYRTPQIIFLSGIFLFYMSIPITLIVGIFVRKALLFSLLLMCLKVVGEMFIMLPGMKLFRQQHIKKYLIPASVLQLPMVIAAILIGQFGKFKWKEQTFSKRADTLN